jgi:hypothetical protein
MTDESRLQRELDQMETRPDCHARGDEASTNRWLDSMSYGDLIVKEMGLSSEVFRLSDPLVATADYGVSSDAISGYAAKLLNLPRTDVISDYAAKFLGKHDARPDSGAFSFPGGMLQSCATSSSG